MRRVAFFLGLLLTIIFVISIIPETAMAKFKKKLLYEDASGYQLWLGRPGPWMYDWFDNGRSKKAADGGRVSFKTGFDEMGNNEPETYYAFGLWLPEGLPTHWQSSSSISITYEDQGNILEMTSVEYFFYSTGDCTANDPEDDNKTYYSRDMKGYLQVTAGGCFMPTQPGPGSKIILIAKFPRECEKVDILSAVVNNVHVNEKVVRGGR